jgi:hypothetical protein
MEAGTRYNDEEIRNQIDAIPVTGDGRFDAEPLFVLVENILKHTAPILDTFLPVRLIIFTPSLLDLYSYAN